MDTEVNVENNTRPLDTSFFPGPVERVQASPAGRDVVVTVRLRAPARWKVKRLGTMVAVDFNGD